MNANKLFKKFYKSYSPAPLMCLLTAYHLAKHMDAQLVKGKVTYKKKNGEEETVDHYWNYKDGKEYDAHSKYSKLIGSEEISKTPDGYLTLEKLLTDPCHMELIEWSEREYEKNKEKIVKMYKTNNSSNVVSVSMKKKGGTN